MATTNPLVEILRDSVRAGEGEREEELLDSEWPAGPSLRPLFGAGRRPTTASRP